MTRLSVGRMLYALIFALGFAAFALGGLASGGTGHTPWIEAVALSMLGAGFALGALPGRWSILARVALPLPTFLVFLTILTDRKPAIPFFAAFAVAGLFALFITAYARFLAEHHPPDTGAAGDHSQT